MLHGTGLRFVLNHMVAPRRSMAALVALTTAMGLDGIEVRNDIGAHGIATDEAARKIAATAKAAGVEIVSINALQRFNDWSDRRAREAAELIELCAAAGAKALVMCPVNDADTKLSKQESRWNLRAALRALAPMLRDRGVVGLVEPLGFEICSLRSKKEAVEAIDDVGGGDVFKLVHDTFHHHLAGEPELFAGRTGLVHISGVTDRTIAVAAMLDAHRVLVDAADRIDNAGQIRALVAVGYRGPLSFEPFAENVHASATIRADLQRSIEFVREAVASAPAST